MGYTKLFSSIVASTIWREDIVTKVVWVTMLAMKNERHIVEGSVPGLAHLAGVKIEDCEKSLRKLLSPDEYSRNKDYNGRRIEAVDGGWLILNGEYYRKKMSLDERREYQRIKQAQYRREEKENANKTTKEFVRPTIEQCRLLAVNTGLPELEGDRFFNYYTSNGWKVGRNAMKSLNAAMATWKMNRKNWGLESQKKPIYNAI